MQLYVPVPNDTSSHSTPALARSPSEKPLPLECSGLVATALLAGWTSPKVLDHIPCRGSANRARLQTLSDRTAHPGRMSSEQLPFRTVLARHRAGQPTIPDEPRRWSLPREKPLPGEPFLPFPNQ